METEDIEDLKAKIKRLQEERDHWRGKAIEQPDVQSQSQLDGNVVGSDTRQLDNEHDRNAIVANDGVKAVEKQVKITNGRPEDDIQTLPSDEAAPALVPQTHEKKTDTTESIRSSNKPTAGEEARSLTGAAEVSVSDTYDFMDDFPNGEWWTRLDEDDGMSRSLDFGSNGFTASLNMGHEILQITAPDSHFGLAYVRGSYADNPDAILARAQRIVGGKSTFGLKWSGGSLHSYRRGDVEYHGLLNFRWPYKKYKLYCAGTLPGTVCSFSFVKDEMVYQVLRFQPGKPVPAPPDIVPNISGSRNISSQTRPPPPPPHPPSQHWPRPWPSATLGLAPKPWDCEITTTSGGTVKTNFSSDFTRNPPYVVGSMGKMISCNMPQESIPPRYLRLNFELSLNGQKQNLSCEFSSQGQKSELDVTIKKSFRIEPGKPTVIVSRISIHPESRSPLNLPFPSSDELVEYLGASMTSENATDRVWGSRIDLNADIDDDDFCTSAACLEQILGVTSVPMRHYLKTPSQIPRPPEASHSGTTSTNDEAEINTMPTKASETLPLMMVDLGKTEQDAETRSPIDRESRNTDNGVLVNEGAVNTQQPSANGELSTVVPVPHALAKKGFATTDFADLVLIPAATSSDHQGDESVKDQKLAGTANYPAAQSEPFDSINPKQDASERGVGGGTVATKLPPLHGLSSKTPVDEILAMDDPDMGIALLGGILGNQYVDVQKSFWQIRYLVKAHNFLATRSDPTARKPLEIIRSIPSLEESTSFERVRTSYLDRIKFQIHHSLVWLARVKLPEGYHVKPSVWPYGDTRPFSSVEDEDNDRSLYPPIAIWYVMQNCPEALPSTFMTTLADCMQNLKTQDIGDIDITSGDHAPKFAILLWYRYTCLAQISHHLRNMPEFMDALSDSGSGDIMNIPSNGEIIEFTSKARIWQKKAEKSMASFRRSSVDSYSDQDESADRLAFLGVELGFAKDNDMKRPSSCLAQARRRILDRKPTVSLNPGTSLFGQDGAARASTAAPWELTCVNHHIRLLLWTDPDLEDGLYAARKNCLRYWSVNFIFVGSWDTSMSNIAAAFWDLDASCMVCATFLDMRTRKDSAEVELDSAALESPKTNPAQLSRRRPSIAIPTELPNEGGFTGEVGRSRGELLSKRELVDDSIIELLRRQLEKQDVLIQTLTTQGDNAFVFDWTRCEPPNTFHPDAWVQSLDDTPELFRAAQTRTVHVRNELERYLNGVPGSVPGAPDWTQHDISDKFTADELLFVSVFDIGLVNDGYRERQVVGRLEPLKGLLLNGVARFRFEFASIFSNGNLEDDLGMWAAYLDGDLDDAISVGAALPDSLRRRYSGISPWIRKAIMNKVVLATTKAQVQDRLLKWLGDSLVDCDTHNRIHFVQKCSRSVVKAFIYMWHRQSIDTFDDHFRNTSIFSDSKTESWISSITISYWGFKAKSNTAHDIFQEPRDTAPFPPKMVSRWHRFKASRGSKKDKTAGATWSPTEFIVEGSSSLVISGDKAGRWWTCSVISSVLPEAVMRQAMNDSTITMTEFIHQPSSGRCLVFLSFLGALCEHLALEYEKLLEALTRAINLGREVLKKGLDWSHAEDAIQRLKSMLWALEALRIFDDRLGESLDVIKEAKDKMRNYLRQGPGRRNEQLERQCQILLEEFDKQHGRLISVHVKIEQKINQISRYREGISAVSNLEDTHTALKQNDTIRILTYITIAYLPLSFIATVFSMSIVTDSNWGPNLFGGLIIVFFISTLVLAKSLGLIIRSWDTLVQTARTKLGMQDPLDLIDIMDQAEDDVEKDKDESGSESEQEEAGSSTSVHRKGPMSFMRNLRVRKKVSEGGPGIVAAP